MQSSQKAIVPPSAQFQLRTSTLRVLRLASFHDIMLSFIGNSLHASWLLLNQSAFYMLLGLLASGLLKMHLSPAYVAAHLGKGSFSSVLKAALVGIPIPLCSCGVLPAAATLKRQGASNGAVTAFLISTPESGIDSISMTWALMDPLMTVARPVSAFLTAAVAGMAENFFSLRDAPAAQETCADLDSAVQGSPIDHELPKSFANKLKTGVKHAANELWGDMAGWFMAGMLLAGVIEELVPDELIATWLGGGLSSMLLMLILGIPLYICASASTPIAAAFVLKGASPGTALVFLLAGPATNVASLTVLVGMLGKRAVGLYLCSIAVVSVLCGLVLDAAYFALGVPAAAVAGATGEALPEWLMLSSTLTLLLLSVRPLLAIFRRWFGRKATQPCSCGPAAEEAPCCGMPTSTEKGSCSCPPKDGQSGKERFKP